MVSIDRRVVLITGASSGIGKASAQYLHQKGYRVYGTSRYAMKLSAADFVSSAQFELIGMDMTSESSISQTVETIIAREGRLDVVVNNAGYGLAGAIEDTQISEAQSLMETNFFGVMRVCRAVLPLMREQGAGYLINISSIAGLTAIPFQALYSASKFAIEGFSEALRMEVQPYGIKVVLIEPGDFQTEFTARRLKTVAAQSETAYTQRLAKALAVMESDEQQGLKPELVGYLLEKIITTSSPQLRYEIAPQTEKLAVELKKRIPGKLYEWMIMKYFNLV